ncbi:MAG: SdrD B-like domain-containing protein [Saprospiraceae bacterium]
MQRMVVRIQIINVAVEQQASGDYTWIDNNANGIQDAGDIPVSGVTVKLYRASDNVLMDQTTTNSVDLQFMVCKSTYYIEFGFSDRIFSDHSKYFR